ncbi:MAG: hypothetical protein EXS51_00495 [Candidatus Taylorbacteria bacterium]|nr:hypothetical protein [Candidatus Taylorbacteria bacterium]
MDTLFLQRALHEVPRLLGQLNRNPSSSTYGSFDRAYWLHRSRDFSCARHQEAVFALALLYAHPFPGNSYAGDKRVLEWINAALLFAVSLQRSDGSFDEWYPFEHSFVCTAFVTVALAKTILILPEDASLPREKVCMALTKAGKWLARHTETTAYNQLAGGVCALYAVYRATKDASFEKAAKQHAQHLLTAQSKEGWWPEYGGPDAGYLSLTVDYLSLYAVWSKDERIFQALRTSTKFLRLCAHMDGTFGGTFMSRNTEYLIPSGVARLASRDVVAKELLLHAHRALKEGKGLQPSNLDDRYVCFLLSNWLEAGLLAGEAKQHAETSSAVLAEPPLFLSESGIYTERSPRRQIIANMYKGGSFVITTLAGRYTDSGIETVFSGKPCTTQSLDRRSRVSYAEGKLHVKGYFKPIREPMMRPLLLSAFRIFQLTLGRFETTGTWVKRLLRKKMVSTSVVSDRFFERDIILEAERIIVIDRFKKENPSMPVRYGTDASYNFIPSARYYSVHDSIGNTLLPRIQVDEEDGQTRITRTFTL